MTKNICIILHVTQKKL